MSPSLVSREVLYQSSYWHESLSRNIIAVDVVLIVTATLTVLLRLVARRCKAITLQADDFMVIIALSATYILAIEAILCAHYGMGEHVPRTAILKMQYALEITWSICTFLVKASVLLLFNRLFGQSSPRFRVCLVICAGFIFAWTFGSFFSAVFRCYPMKYFWDTSIEGSCTNARAGRIAADALNTITDVAMLVLPLPMVWKLVLPLRQKLAVAAIFGLGIFCLAASAIRLHYSTRISTGDDPNAINADFILWSTIEPFAGIICACLPVLGPILSVSSARAWLQTALRISHLCPVTNEKAKPSLFTRFPFSTRVSSDTHRTANAPIPRSLKASRHTSVTYSQAVGSPCCACGGTGIEPCVDEDLERGKVKGARVDVEEVKETKLTIHDVRRWGREHLCDSGIWGYGKVPL